MRLAAEIALCACSFSCRRSPHGLARGARGNRASQDPNTASDDRKPHLFVTCFYLRRLRGKGGSEPTPGGLTDAHGAAMPHGRSRSGVPGEGQEHGPRG